MTAAAYENGIPLKEALKDWENKNGKKAAEAEVIKLCGNQPPIGKLDATASTLANCTQLSLSTNLIEKLSNMVGLKQLKILSVGRNRIKSFSGVEAVAGTLEELWASYNLVDRMKGVDSLKKLKVLYMGNNRVREWKEVQKLAELPLLNNFVLVNNPLEEQMTQANEWRNKVPYLLRHLERLDGIEVIRKEAVLEAEIMEDEEEPQAED